MPLGDVTPEGVRRAVAEFDRVGRARFLEDNGFGEARGYWLRVGTRRYDSKAIVGVAHGFDRADLGRLGANEFVGGEATVARLLRRLGFEVEQTTRRNPPWSEDELIVALDLYLEHGLLDDRDPRLIEASAILNRIGGRPESSATFRNANGVALKLANFAALDPAYPGRGMQRGSRLDREVWGRFSGDRDALRAEAERVREGVPAPLVPSGVVRVGSGPIEQVRAESFGYQSPARDIEAHRREQVLVTEFEAWLVAQGHVVERHTYRVAAASQPLACDLFDETTRTLYEAKAEVGRSDVRMAIGQLFDYRRFEVELADVQLAVLLPRAPSADLADLLEALAIGTAYRDKDGFVQLGPR